MQVAPDVEAVLAGFHSTGKPIALCCIAPVLAAKSFPGVTLTVGKANGDEWPFGGTISAVEELGAHHVECSIDQVHVDKDNKYDPHPHTNRSSVVLKHCKSLSHDAHKSSVCVVGCHQCKRAFLHINRCFPK